MVGFDYSMFSHKPRPAPIMLQRRLRAGVTPKELGAEPCGRGVQKQAYRLGDWIIKENTGGVEDWGKNKHNRHLLPKKLRTLGFRPVKTYIAGKYVIQEAVEVWCDTPNKPENLKILYNYIGKANGYDTHGGNIGINSLGNLVCFDW